MTKALKTITSVLAIGTAIYHILFVIFGGLSSSEHNIMHVLLVMALVVLQQAINQEVRYKRLLLLLLLVASTATLTYTFLRAQELQLHTGMFLSDTDFAVGVVIITCVVIVSWLQWGRILTAVLVIALIYFFFGSGLPGALGFPRMQPWYVMSFLGMGIGSGLFGFLTPASASMVFYFMLFSGVLSATGVLPMFLEVGKWLGMKLRGGAALTALVGSSLVGTITGASVANVALTGTYTIPTMKKQGFPPHQASAIESIASSGGQIMPPVMGAGAFIMSSLVGVSYFEIIVNAIWPALLYYGATFIGVMVLIRRLHIQITEEEKVDAGLIKQTLPAFIIPLVILVILLAQVHSVAWSTIWAMVATIVVSMFSRRTRPSIKKFFVHFADGAMQGAQIGVAIAAIALVSQTAISTGLGPRVSEIVFSLSAGIVPIALILVMIGSILLGMGMTTVAAYTIVAIVMVPTLRQMGIDRMAAHFFAFYFAVFSSVTPPIATAAIVGSQIAKTSFWKCAWAGFKLAIPLFLIPYAFVTEPALLQFPLINVQVLLMLVILIASALSMAVINYSYFLIRLNKMETFLFAACTFMFALYVIAFQYLPLLIAAAAVFTLGTVTQLSRWRSLKNSTV